MYIYIHIVNIYICMVIFAEHILANLLIALLYILALFAPMLENLIQSTGNTGNQWQ